MAMGGLAIADLTIVCSIFFLPIFFLASMFQSLHGSDGDEEDFFDARCKFLAIFFFGFILCHTLHNRCVLKWALGNCIRGATTFQSHHFKLRSKCTDVDVKAKKKRIIHPL